MSRMSMWAITTKAKDSEFVGTLAAIAKKTKMPFSSVCDDYSNLIEKVSQWSVLPEIVVFDVPDDIDVFKALNELSAAVPEGNVNLVLTGVPNDILIYRQLKAFGVSEIFSDDISEEDLEKVIADIATRELRETEIDPRRAVYVWSASGGSGGTSVSLAMSKQFAKEGKRTLHIDLDILTAPASYLFSAKEGAIETYGLIEALMTPNRIDSVFLERSIQRVDKNLFYLSGRKKLNDDGFDTAAVSMLIARAQRNFDMIVIDTPWRNQPETDWGKVNGTSYIVANPTATSFIGFSMISKEISATPSQTPTFLILNKKGEFKSNDFSDKAFAEGFDGEILPLQYDPAACGKMFFAQKTLIDLGGKIAKQVKIIMKTLPTTDKPVAKKSWLGGLLS